jgi:transposase-like protein
LRRVSTAVRGDQGLLIRNEGVGGSNPSIGTISNRIENPERVLKRTLDISWAVQNAHQSQNEATGLRGFHRVFHRMFMSKFIENRTF